MSEPIPDDVVDEAILVLDVYASQAYWSPVHVTRAHVALRLGVCWEADLLSLRAWNKGRGLEIGELLWSAAEGAQLLREGWRP